MRFSLAAATAALAGLASGAAIAARTPETITITDFSVRKQVDGTVTAVNFRLTGDDAAELACGAQDPGFPSAVITCGESKYRFALWNGEKEDFALRIYHELGTAYGRYGVSDVFAYCHAGGLGDLLCTQQFPVSFVINSA